MNCRDTQERLIDLFDSATPTGVAAELRAHLAACEICAREYAQLQAAVASIEPPLRVQASPDFKERVMNKITEPEAPRGRWRILIPRLAAVSAVALVLVALAPMLDSLGRKGGQQPTPVMSLLAQSVQAMSNLQSIHITARMRTLPRENFEYINPRCEFLPLEIWKQYGNPAKWRVEKPGRRVAVDGQHAVMLIGDDRASKHSPRANYLSWLNVLLDSEQIMEQELQLARAQISKTSLGEQDHNGVRQLVLTVERKASNVGNDWVKNKSVSESDHTRIYRFDPVTKRLEGMQIVLHAADGDSVVFEITGIRYNEPLDPALFTLVVPQNAIWSVDPEKMPTNRPLPNSPKEAAIMAFDAMSREDWPQALVVFSESDFNQNFKTMFGGLQVISTGEPFQSGLYRGWFVPYEIKLKSGQVRKHNLALRNDNAAKRWVLDGGL